MSRSLEDQLDDIDPRFTSAHKHARKRKRQNLMGNLVLPLALISVVSALLGVAVWLTWDMWSFGPSGPVEVAEDELEVDMVALEREAAAASAAFAAAFIDIAGDPMIINLGDNDTSQTVKELYTTGTLDPSRVPAGMVLVDDIMVSAEVRFMTTLPSSQEDFAFFQVQRSTKTAGGAAPQRTEADEAAASVSEAVEEAVEARDGTAATDDEEGGGWGTTIDHGQAELPGFEKTRIENTTSVAFVRQENDRHTLSDDTFAKISAYQPVSELMMSKGIGEEEATAIADAASEHLGINEVAPGQVAALRTQLLPSGGRRFVQMSLYDTETFFGTIARSDNNTIGPGSDPWVEDELFDYAEGEDESLEQEQRYRMLDALYSTAIRNRVPAVVVGEAIALLSKKHDLNAFANPGDRMVMLYAAERVEEDTGAGQILYVALKGKSVDVECFVYRSRPGGDYGCYGAKPGAGGSGGSGGLRDGMVTPVQGVLTSRFGPRTHPVLKTVRLHKGVDWAAPTGTPIYAAFDGTVSYAGDGKGYGNLVKIKHANGFETRYAHLNEFGTKGGAKVSAGDLIGYVGTTGLSTGPHLHFELYLDGQAIDPFGGGGGGGSGAVETLVNQIIRVESAGNANAKNPLSTATGLGQFIESTWIRMMRTYRPDLVASLSREELLALRTDPTISREMVKNLAREGESYLRARGHSITAGRLYLCHFLGADGAHKVLSSTDDQMLIDVLGASVIKANPFLTGKNVAYIKEWAERKMRGRGGGPVIVAEPAGLPAYRKEIQALVGTG